MSLQCMSEKISVRFLVIATGILHPLPMKAICHGIFEASLAQTILPSSEASRSD